MPELDEQDHMDLHLTDIALANILVAKGVITEAELEIERDKVLTEAGQEGE